MSALTGFPFVVLCLWCLCDNRRVTRFRLAVRLLLLSFWTRPLRFVFLVSFWHPGVRSLSMPPSCVFCGCPSPSADQDWRFPILPRCGRPAPTCGRFVPFDQAQCRLGLFTCVSSRRRRAAAASRLGLIKLPACPPSVHDDGAPQQPPVSALVTQSACPPSVPDDGASLQPSGSALISPPA